MNKSAIGKLKASAALLALTVFSSAAMAGGEQVNAPNPTNTAISVNAPVTNNAANAQATKPQTVSVNSNQASASLLQPQSAKTQVATPGPVTPVVAPVVTPTAAPAAPVAPTTVATPQAPANGLNEAANLVKNTAEVTKAAASDLNKEVKKEAAPAPAKADKASEIDNLIKDISNTNDKSTGVEKLSANQKIEKTQGANIVASGATTSNSNNVGVVGMYSSGDIAWILIATALVLLMITPGVTMFYSGLVRKKNAISIFAQTFIGISIVSLIWLTFGYSLAFRGEGSFIGDLSAMFLNGFYPTGPADATSVYNKLTSSLPETAYALYQLSFALITPVLVIGAFAERIQFRAIVIFFAAWTTLAYIPIAHWVWSPNGFISTMNGLDWAGGLVVHLNAGIAAFVGALILGRRKDFGKEAIIPRSTSTAVAGAGFLLVGWLGFNGGSALAADGKAIWAIITTIAAATAGGATWAFFEYQRRKYVSSLGIASGIVAGLVAITPAAGFVGIGSSLLIGLLGSAGAFLFLAAKSKFKFDDALDVFAVHGIPGLIGTVMTGLLAIGTLTGKESSLFAQLAGAGVVMFWSGLVTAIIFIALKKAKWLRVDKEEEEDGCDLADHGEIEM